ncbi:hypothetical protein GOP47_0007486 [Adiantum capillus-veneris]|uniref:Uncharacterized protein n=1 Tax=Adiantum capillus-veneris TaxID=13818 RepID=A0A9D4ZKZ2_ADICA|nr:hypothetical protein GOP47_0007486 [Adiantum capillus-veneris]
MSRKRWTRFPIRAIANCGASRLPSASSLRSRARATPLTKGFATSYPISIIASPAPHPGASEYGLRPKKGQGQLFQDNRVDQNSIIAHLQDQMEQLEQKMLEKENQLQAVESSIGQAELLRLQSTVEGLQEQILLKQSEMERTINQLSGTQHELESLQCLLEKVESDAKANSHAEKVYEELQSLQCQSRTMANGQKYQSKALDVDGISVELTRRKYSAAIMVAKHNPTDELLVLVAELRGQLQASLLLSDNGVHV